MVMSIVLWAVRKGAVQAGAQTGQSSATEKPTASVFSLLLLLLLLLGQKQKACATSSTDHFVKLVLEF